MCLISGRIHSHKPHRRAGFTLVEVMVAAAVLSLGAVLIYEAFFISLDTLNHCSNYLNAITYIDEKLWQIQDSLIRYNNLTAQDTSGTITAGDKDFNWGASYQLIDGSGRANLYKIDLVFFWNEGSKMRRLSRQAYAMYVQK